MKLSLVRTPLHAIPDLHSSCLTSRLPWTLMLLVALGASGCEFTTTSLQALRLTSYVSHVDLTTKYTVEQVDPDDSFEAREMLVGLEYRLVLADEPAPANSLPVVTECFMEIVDPVLGSLRGTTRELTLSSGPSSVTLQRRHGFRDKSLGGAVCLTATTLSPMGIRARPVFPFGLRTSTFALLSMIVHRWPHQTR